MILPNLRCVQLIDPSIRRNSKSGPSYSERHVGTATNLLFEDSQNQKVYDVQTSVPDPIRLIAFNLDSYTSDAEIYDEREGGKFAINYFLKELTFGDLNSLTGVASLLHEVGHLNFETQFPLSEAQRELMGEYRDRSEYKLEKLPPDQYTLLRRLILGAELGSSLFGAALLKKLKDLGIDFYPTVGDKDKLATAFSSSFRRYRIYYRARSDENSRIFNEQIKPYIASLL